MDLYHLLYQEIFFQGLDWVRGRKNIERLKFLRKSQYWDIEQIKKWQLDKLNNLLFQAKNYSPFHKERLKNLKLPLQSLKEIDRLPILKKEEMRRHFQTILCTNIHPKQCELSRTGGSTGEPSYYYLDKSSKDWNRGSVYRGAEWAGTFLGDRTVIMMGSHYDYNESKKLKNKLTLFFQRYKDCSVAYINDALLEKYYNEILRFRPKGIWGYASGISCLAKYIAEHHPNTSFDFLNAIITSSETLQPQWRDKINCVLGGRSKKVFDHYGSREMYIASECREQNGYHIHAENIYLEVVDNDGYPLAPGQLGKIVVTDLTNRAFPFIRYEIGDVGILSKRTTCPCGIKLPLLEKISGRMGDLVILKNRALTSPNFTILFSDFEGIDSFQVVQNNKEELIINIVKNDKFQCNVLTYIEDSLKKLTGGEIKISICPVENIVVPKSGKHRFVISKVTEG